MIRNILDLYIFLLIFDVILSYLPQFKKYPATQYLRKVSDLSCRPMRKLLGQVIPNDIPFDFSPFAVILGITILKALW